MQKQNRFEVIRHTVFPDEPSNTARNVLQIPANSTKKDILIGDFPKKIRNNVVPSPFRTLSQNLKTVKQNKSKKTFRGRGQVTLHRQPKN